MLSSPRRRFLLLFCLTLALTFSLLSLNSVNDRFVEPFTATLAKLAGKLLLLFGEEVRTSGTLIQGPRFAVNVRNGCNGIEALVVFAAAIVAHPSCRKFLPLLLGSLVLQTANLFRVAGLYAAGLYLPGLFPIFHTVVGQTVLILLAVLLFLYYVPPDPKRRP